MNLIKSFLPNLLTLVFSLAIILTSFSSKSYASEEILQGFNLKHCSQELCTSLEVDEALRSHLDNIYVFTTAKLTTFNSKKEQNSQEKVLLGKEGYYDPTHNRIVLRGLPGKFKEVIFNLDTGRFLYF